MRAKLQVGGSFVATLMIAALSLPASAQEDARVATERCRALPSEAERLDCMERLVFDLSSSSTQPSLEASEAAPAASAAIEAPEARGDGERRLFRLPFSGGRDEAASSAAVEAAAVDEAESFGAERLETRSSESRDPDVMTARVVSYEEAPYQRLRVTLDNGQVWEQREAVPPWREEQFGAPDEVEIFRSRFGGYRLRLVGKNVSMSAERVR